MKTSSLRILPVLGTAFLLACSGRGGSTTSSPMPENGPGKVPQESGPFVVVEPPAPKAPPAGGPAAAPLRHVYLHAAVQVRDDVARTVVTDVYVNDSDAPVGFTYRFPLPGDATVSNFADVQDGKRVEAQLGERDKARQAYDEAASKGAAAGLAEADGAMGFRMALTPLAPHESRRVELTYVQSLLPLGGERNYVYPVFHEGAAAAYSELDVVLTARTTLQVLESPNHPEARVFRGSEGRGRVLLGQGGAPLGDDVVVRWTETSEPLDFAVRAVASEGDDAGYVEARFAFTKDPATATAPPRDVVFVVDTSLSMSGQALTRAKEVVDVTLQNLTARDRLALVTFDGAVRGWSGLAAADEAARQRVRDELGGARASGASNLDAAIDRAHELLAKSEHPSIVLATDGQPTVGEDLDTLRPATSPDALRGTQVVLALFNYPSRQKALEAVFPNLTTVYVPSGDAAKAATRKAAALASAPTLEGVSLELEGLEADTLHGRIPAKLSLGESFRVAGRAKGPVKARVTGTLRGEAVTMTRELTAAPVQATGDPLPMEWARLRIADLETVYREKGDANAKKEIGALATKFHLVSSFTSLVATADSLSPDRIAPGDPEIRVRAPRGATAVRAVLPWGEIVECSYLEGEDVWFGRFLVPRAMPDGLYRVRVLLDHQGTTTAHTTLPFRVDSKPPEFKVTVRPTKDGLRVEAKALRDVFDGHGASLRKDLVDVRTVTVRLGTTKARLERTGDETWSAVLPRPDKAGRYQAEVVASDAAHNTSRSTVTVEIRP